MAAMGSAQKYLRGSEAVAAEDHAHCVRWFLGDGVGGWQQCLILTQCLLGWAGKRAPVYLL